MSEVDLIASIPNPQPVVICKTCRIRPAEGRSRCPQCKAERKARETAEFEARQAARPCAIPAPKQYWISPERYSPRPCNRCGKPYMARNDVKKLRPDEVYCSDECCNLPPPTRETVMDYVTVDPETGCWNWKYDHGSDGRPELYIKDGTGKRKINKPRMAPYVYELFNGALADDKEACHHCDRAYKDERGGGCVNPNHIFAGTHTENIQDCIAKGRNARGTMQPNARLTDQIVRELRQRYANGETVTALAAEKGISIPGAHKAIHRKTWKHVD
jgi:hypothetical protein